MESIDVLCQEDNSPNSAEEIPTIAEQENKGVAERVPNFEIELVGFLLRGGKHEYGWTPSQQDQSLTTVIHSWIKVFQDGTSKALHTTRISSLAIRGSSRITLDF